MMTLVSAFSAKAASLPLISGSAKLDATVHGSFQKPKVSGHLSAQNLRVQGSEWKSAAFSVTASSSQIAISRGVLISATRGRATFDSTIALRNWSYLPSDSIHANLSAQQLSLTDLERLAHVQYPVSGDLSANLSLNGSQLNPSGSGSITLTNARAYDEPIQTLALKFEGSDGTITSRLRVAATAGEANASLRYTPRTRSYKVALDAPAIVLQKLHTLQEKNQDLQGTLSATANGVGTLDDPQLTADIRIPKLDMRQGSIGALRAQANVARKHATFTLNSQVAEASIRARGDVDLTGDYQASASVDTSPVPLYTLLASFSNTVPQGFQGQTEFHATLKGPLKDKARLEAHITIPTLTASYQQLQIAAAGPIHADYANSIVTLEPTEIRGTGTSLRIQGKIPLQGSSAPSLTAQGTLDVRVLSILRPDLKGSGTVSLDLHASGSRQSPSVQGRVQLKNIALITADEPIGVEKLNGTLEVNNDRVQIATMNGDVGGGNMSLGGSIAFRPSLQFNLALQGTSIRVRYPQGLRTLLDGNLTFSGDMQASSLNGQILIDSLSFTPDFDVASFSDQFSSNAAIPAQPGFADTVQLAIGVQSKSNLSARSSQVSLEGDVLLRASGTAANPVITGRTDLTSGELFYRSNRYQLQRGIITFNDPDRINPNLDVSVKTEVEQYNLTITLRGPLDRLTTSYVSDPPLATADIINLIAFGKTTSESASSSSQSTDSMIASGATSAIGSGLSSGIQKFAGLSSLQINPLLGGNSQNPSAQIALQQRVTRNLLFTFSTDVSQPGEELVQGEYQINKRWSVSVTRDQVGGVSVDGRLHTKF
jgi:translocation and assembly module TamB